MISLVELLGKVGVLGVGVGPRLIGTRIPVSSPMGPRILYLYS